MWVKVIEIMFPNPSPRPPSYPDPSPHRLTSGSGTKSSLSLVKDTVGRKLPLLGAPVWLPSPPRATPHSPRTSTVYVAQGTPDIAV